jgi:hypothetical protein
VWPHVLAYLGRGWTATRATAVANVDRLPHNATVLNVGHSYRSRNYVDAQTKGGVDANFR